MGGDAASGPADRGRVERALHRLPQAYAQALRLRDSGLPADRLAMYLDIPAESVRVFLRIAEDKLGAALADDDAGR